MTKVKPSSEAITELPSVGKSKSNSALNSSSTLLQPQRHKPWNQITQPSLHQTLRKNRKAATQVGNEKWVHTRSPALLPLVGNVFVDAINLDDDSVLIMAKAYHLLSVCWLNAVRGNQETHDRKSNVLNDCKDYKEVLKDSKNLIYEILRFKLKKVPTEEENT